MSNSAERVRAHRRRRRRGLRCVTVRLSEAEIDTLVATQYLAASARRDAKAIKDATEAFVTEKLLDCAAKVQGPQAETRYIELEVPKPVAGAPAG